MTIGPLAPGLYGYNFEIDGVQTVDSKNPDVKLPSSVKVEHHVIEGGHAWAVWRWALAEFLPKIFQ